MTVPAGIGEAMIAAADDGRNQTQEAPAMKEHPTDKDLLKEGTRTKASPAAVAKTVVTGLLTGLPRTVAGLRQRLRRSPKA